MQNGRCRREPDSLHSLSAHLNTRQTDRAHKEQIHVGPEVVGGEGEIERLRERETKRERERERERETKRERERETRFSSILNHPNSHNQCVQVLVRTPGSVFVGLVCVC